MTRSISVEIFGERYIIHGDSEEPYMKELARFVDKMMREVADNTKAISRPKIAILAAINITHELFQLKLRQKETEEAIEKRTEAIIKSIESIERIAY